MIFSFHPYNLDTEVSQLFCDEKEVALEPRVLDLLVFLIKNRHRVVTKDEIIEEVWGGRFTSDAAVTTCLKSLRKALNDDGSQQRFIKTQRGRGFRFVANIEEQSPANVEIQSPPIKSEHELIYSVHQGKPSIIVLPFQSSLSDVKDEILSEAIAHELIQELSRLRWLRVIARGTAFRFRESNPNLYAIGQQLGVRYALCGVIESFGNVRTIMVELSDCETNDVVWAERFEVQPDSLHEVRANIAACVISSLEMYIPLNEASQAALKSSENLDAWANYHLGLRHMFRFTQPDNLQAAHHFQQAIEKDAGFARAYAGLSFSRFQDAFLKYDNDVSRAVTDARHLAEQSVNLDPLDPFCNYNMGRSFWLAGDPDGGLSWLDRSVTLSPNFAQGHYSKAFTEVMQGHVESALNDSGRALNLSPLDPLLYAIYAVRALSHMRVGDIEQAIQWAEKAALAPGAHFLIHMIAAVIYVDADNPGRARYWKAKVLERKPDANAMHFFSAFPFSHDDFRQRLSKGLKQAGF